MTGGVVKLATKDSQAVGKVSFRPFFTILSECKSNGDWFRSLQVLQHIRRQGLQLSTVPSTMALASCAGGSGDGTPVPRMRGEMPGPRAQWRWAVQLLGSMRQAQLETNLFAWSACVSSCEKSQLSSSNSLYGDLWPLGLQFLADACNDACGSHVVPSSAAMACCEKARRGQWDKAIHLLQEMPRSSVEANVISLGAALSSCQKSFCWGTTLELLGAAKQSSLRPNTIVVNSAISVCEKFELWEVALEFLDLNSSAVSFGACLGAFDLGSWFGSLQLFSSMMQQRLLPLVSTWNSALSSSCGNWRWAAELLGHIRSPDALSLASAITAFAAGIQTEASVEALMNSLHAVHQKLKRIPGDHSGCDAEVLKATGRAGRWQQSLQILEEAAAKIRPMPGIAGVLRASLLWNQAAWSCEASWQPARPLPKALAKSELLLPF